MGTNLKSAKVTNDTTKARPVLAILALSTISNHINPGRAAEPAFPRRQQSTKGSVMFDPTLINGDTQTAGRRATRWQLGLAWGAATVGGLLFGSLTGLMMVNMEKNFGSAMVHHKEQSWLKISILVATAVILIA